MNLFPRTTPPTFRWKLPTHKRAGWDDISHLLPGAPFGRAYLEWEETFGGGRPSHFTATVTVSREWIFSSLSEPGHWLFQESWTVEGESLADITLKAQNHF